VPYVPPTIAEVAAEVAACLAEGDDDSGRRLAFRFIEQFDNAGEEDRRRMVAEPPASTGDKRYDAMMAALVEYSCVHHDVSIPSWVDEPDRFLEEWWFVSGMRSLHANAIVHSPISFKRRGVFITEGSLTYA
jgi:hypothetical protein